MSEKLRDKIAEANKAHTDLNVFAVVVSILEGGHLYDARTNAAAFRIIDICKKEQDRCLRRYDAAMAKAGAPYK